jgi:hypothetical protein
MTAEEKAKLQWYAGRTAELAHGTSSSVTTDVAQATALLLKSAFIEDFPAAMPALAATRAQRTPVDPAAGVALMVTEGPKLWAILHPRALAWDKAGPHTDAEIAAEMTWLVQFARSIPCQICATFFYQYLAVHPTDFTKYLAWTVDLHNTVNAKPNLKKPTLTLEQAIARWTPAK